MNTQHKLSATGKLAVVIGLAYAAPALAAPSFYSGAPAADAFARTRAAQAAPSAANIEAVQGGAQISQQKGVDIVNIVKPNEHGLSHNQFNKYNVSEAGAVLNNALQAGNSQLAGQLGANSNFQGKAAEVILNEVVSKNPSLILGQQEIFGMAADYVLANPNGITYNGGNIINAPRASLVVGSAEVANGKLEGFNTNNANALNVSGAVGGVSILDLVAPRVIVNAGSKLSADKAINVVSGANKVGYTNGKVEKLAQDAKAPVLDGQIFGSMNAGSIRIHATDDRATQTLKNADISATQDLTTDVAGSLKVSASKLSGADITLGAKNTTIDGVVNNSGSNVPAVESGTLAQNVKFTKNSNANTQTFAGSSIHATGALTLNNTGDVSITGADIKAGSLNIDANDVNAGSVVTSNNAQETYRRTKGLWHNQTTSATQDQTIHRTNIDVKGDATVSAKNALTLQGAKLNAGEDVKLSGANGVTFKGITATDTSESGLDIRNESGKLKTGTAAKAELTQEFAATEITAGGDLGLQTGKTLTTAGAKMAATGSAIVDADSVNLGTAITQTSNAVSDKFKYWGGLAGGKEDGKTYTQEELQSTSLTAAGDLLIGAKNGVSISGSTVKGGTDAKVNAGAGQLDITGAKSSTSTSEKTRTGTIFNITKSSSSKQSDVEVVTGAQLASDTNLQLLADKDVNVLGSSLKAAQNLGIETVGSLKVGTVATNSNSKTSSFAIKGFAEGDAKASEKNGDVVAEATGGVGIRFIKNSNDTQTTDHVGSDLNAENINLTAKKDATLVSSNVTASQNVNVTAENVSTLAAQDVTVSNDTSRVTEIGLTAGAGVSGFDPKVTVKLGVGSQYESATTTNGTAQVNKVTGGNVNITAQDSIKHEGTNISATSGDITQSAQTITQTNANNINNVDKVQHAGGAFIGGEVSSSNGLKVSAGIYGNGGTAQGVSNTAVSGSLNAANNVTLNADKVTDVATNYDVANNVKITADQYSNEAAASNSSYTANQGGASLTLSANTKDLTNVNVNLGAKVNYQHLNTEASNATIGNMTAGSVDIVSKQDVNFASNVNTTQGVNISSTEGNVTFTQSNNTLSSTSTGVDVGLNVGATVNVATGAVLPKGGAGVEVTHGKTNSSTGTAGTITAEGSVNVTASDNASIAVNGASIISNGAVNLTAGNVSSSALEHSKDSLNVAAGGKFSLGTGMVTETTEHTETYMVKDNYCAPPREETVTYTTEEEKLAINSVGVGAHADVTKESGVSHTANQIVAKGESSEKTKLLPSIGDSGPQLVPVKTEGGLTINATNTNGTGITTAGTNMEASTATLTAAGGNVTLGSAEGSLKRTGGGAGLNISGSVSQEGFKPTAGDGYINVDLANNKTYTGSSLNANNVNVTSAGDLNLNSSTITAQNVTAKVEGDVNIVSQQNIVDETKVGLAAAGGKGIDPKSLTTTETVTTTMVYDVVTGTWCAPEHKTVVVEETHEETYVDAGKVAGQVLSDLQNGTIMGVKAEAKIDVDVEKSKTSQAAGITANTLDVNAGGDVALKGGTVQYENGTGFGDSKVSVTDNQDSSKTFTLGVDVGTNVPKMVSYGIQHATTGTSPLFNTSATKAQAVVLGDYTKTETPVAPVVDVVTNTNVDPFDPFSQQPIVIGNPVQPTPPTQPAEGES